MRANKSKVTGLLHNGYAKCSASSSVGEPGQVTQFCGGLTEAYGGCY
jgi:hypothetical protein